MSKITPTTPTTSPPPAETCERGITRGPGLVLQLCHSVGGDLGSVGNRPLAAQTREINVGVPRGVWVLLRTFCGLFADWRAHRGLRRVRRATEPGRAQSASE